jgi:type II secretory pathway pseudopilin PulG
MINKNTKNGFSLLVAIFVIMLLSIVASYIFYASSLVTNEGRLQYQKEQAAIYARSYTEYAVLAISGNNRNSGQCITDINANIGNPNIGQGYKIVVKISYIGNNKYVKNCNTNNVVANLSDTSDDDTLFAIIDVYVSYRDTLHKSINTGWQKNIPWQTYHKRSIQKI